MASQSQVRFRIAVTKEKPSIYQTLTMAICQKQSDPFSKQSIYRYRSGVQLDVNPFG
jgi:hypothetical protein